MVLKIDLAVDKFWANKLQVITLAVVLQDVGTEAMRMPTIAHSRLYFMSAVHCFAILRSRSHLA